MMKKEAALRKKESKAMLAEGPANSKMPSTTKGLVPLELDEGKYE